jgi:DNA-3-methyladenine glycosylase I
MSEQTTVDALPRCPWPGEDPLYLAYHDREWGVPEYDDRALFEKLVLDGFQAGLSWIIILRKRENFRRAFEGFDPHRIARYTPRRIETLMRDPGIVRNRLKIEGAVRSARAWLDVMERGPGFARLLWDFVDGAPRINRPRNVKEIPAETDLSRAISRELAQRGFRFVGPTIVYAFMQAVGIVNDHLVSCHRHPDFGAPKRRRAPATKSDAVKDARSTTAKQGRQARAAVGNSAGGRTGSRKAP